MQEHSGMNLAAWCFSTDSCPWTSPGWTTSQQSSRRLSSGNTSWESPGRTIWTLPDSTACPSRACWCVYSRGEAASEGCKGRAADEWLPSPLADGPPTASAGLKAQLPVWLWTCLACCPQGGATGALEQQQIVSGIVFLPIRHDYSKQLHSPASQPWTLFYPPYPSSICFMSL